MKKQYLPQEIEVWFVIPCIRRELAKAMAKKGLSQTKIASILGITGAAVSQYTKNKRAKEVEFSQELLAEIQRSSDAIIKDNDSLISELQRILNLVKSTKALCELHHKFGTIPKKCGVCIGA